MGSLRILSGHSATVDYACCNQDQSPTFPQPIEPDWTPAPPAQNVSRRQIVENMPDPLCPLFEDLYLTQGLEAPRRENPGKALKMVGGGPMFVTVNGYGYQRFDWPNIVKDMDARRNVMKVPCP
ncbi:MAG: hypothetical protein CM15mP84_01770 [Cellvibrionales bacterium]|nr:MAG: hypothetical protein CM15mP84_01770 [Cellvibrionales bacterium]